MGVAISVPIESLKAILDRIYRIDRIGKTVIGKIAWALRGPSSLQEPGGKAVIGDPFDRLRAGSNR